MLNSLNYTEVHVEDPHSDVATALIKNCRVRTMASCIRGVPAVMEYANQDGVLLISPDAGANKKVGEVARLLCRSSFIRADKERDCRTGEITNTRVWCNGQLEPHKCLIVDDICDGGRTFIELGKKLKQAGAQEVALYVTHGIFSKGLDVFAGSIDHIFAQNTLSGERQVVRHIF